MALEGCARFEAHGDVPMQDIEHGASHCNIEFPGRYAMRLAGQAHGPRRRRCCSTRCETSCKAGDSWPSTPTLPLPTSTTSPRQARSARQAPGRRGPRNDAGHRARPGRRGTSSCRALAGKTLGHRAPGRRGDARSARPWPPAAREHFGRRGEKGRQGKVHPSTSPRPPWPPVTFMCL